MIYWVSYFLIKLLSWIYFPCTFIGRENIPAKGAFLITSNHISNLDPFLIGSGFSRKLNYLAKEELFRTKFTNFFFRKVGAFPIKRGGADLGAIKEVFKRLKSEEPVLLFPEGTRTLDPAKRKIQAGVGLIAAKSGLPVIPVYINGSDKVLPAGAKWLKRNRVTVTFGKAFQFTKGKPNISIAQEIMDNIFRLAETKAAPR
ncbi:Acyl-CoA:1-acyl-sn-glycerol-3-phosphate acyltransferase [hydrothermal vent metagenome]|uniref:Acyl-CoA:1-acyl-sn-glycerol-3-phosphate acyltransferase n=1 Tax=hydrothermal vent metagenome TaxID=652676 RepID=A0A3B1DLS7_9ZZZZ